MTNQTIKLLSEETNLTQTKIQNIYLEYWKGIKQIMREMDFDTTIDKDIYIKQKRCFNLIGLGKLGATYDYYKKQRDRYDKYKNDTSNV